MREHGALAVVEALQSDAWKIEKIYDHYPYITTTNHPMITSEIVLGNTHSLGEGEKALNAEVPTITLRSFMRYAPTSHDEYGDAGELEYVVDEFHDEGGQSPKLFQKL